MDKFDVTEFLAYCKLDSVPKDLETAAEVIEHLESQLISAEKRAHLAEVKLEGEEAMRRELAESLHYANGVADLAMKHRDEAESRLVTCCEAMRAVRDDLVSRANGETVELGATAWNKLNDAIDSERQRRIVEKQDQCRVYDAERGHCLETGKHEECRFATASEEQ